MEPTTGPRQLIPKNPFVCPKEGITPIHSYSKDGIGTRKILFDREGSGFLGILFKKNIHAPNCFHIAKKKVTSRKSPNNPPKKKQASLNIYPVCHVSQLILFEKNIPKISPTGMCKHPSPCCSFAHHYAPATSPRKTCFFATNLGLPNPRNERHHHQKHRQSTLKKGVEACWLGKHC